MKNSILFSEYLSKAWSNKAYSNFPTSKEFPITPWEQDILYMLYNAKYSYDEVATIRSTTVENIKEVEKNAIARLSEWYLHQKKGK